MRRQRQHHGQGTPHKAGVNARGWKGKVRISTSGCMGLCAQGSNVIIYPQKIWLSGVAPEQVEALLSLLEELIVAHDRGNVES